MADMIKTVESEMDEIIQVATQLTQNHSTNINSSNTNINTNTSKASPPSVNGTAAPTSEEDNMDYDSDDDDDSKSNHSSSTNQNNRKKRQKGEVQRSHHNVLERKRRDLIKDSFSKLRDAVPTLTNERASRAHILKKAADFIQLTHQKNESIKADIEELIKKNRELENKIIVKTEKQDNIEAETKQQQQ